MTRSATLVLYKWLEEAPRACRDLIGQALPTSPICGSSKILFYCRQVHQRSNPRGTNETVLISTSDEVRLSVLLHHDQPASKHTRRSVKLRSEQPFASQVCDFHPATELIELLPTRLCMCESSELDHELLAASDNLSLNICARHFDFELARALVASGEEG